MNRIFKRGAVIVALLIVVLYAGFLYEDWKPHGHAHHDQSDTYHEHSHSESSIQQSERLLFPSREPDRVVSTSRKKPETSLAVTRRTNI